MSATAQDARMPLTALINLAVVESGNEKHIINTMNAPNKYKYMEQLTSNARRA
jgi:hypothetical protein